MGKVCPVNKFWKRSSVGSEHLVYTQEVKGSNPFVSTNIWYYSSAGQSAGLKNQRSFVQSEVVPPSKISSFTLEGNKRLPANNGISNYFKKSTCAV